jgi:hypothetical protein
MGGVTMKMKTSVSSAVHIGVIGIKAIVVGFALLVFVGSKKTRRSIGLGCAAGAKKIQEKHARRRPGIVPGRHLP